MLHSNFQLSTLNFQLNNHSASYTHLRLLIVNHSELSGSNTLQFLRRKYMTGVTFTDKTSFNKFRSMTNLEGYIYFIRAFLPRVSGDKMKIGKRKLRTILCFCVIAMRHINNILFNVLLYHKPRAATQSQSFTLTDSVKPISPVSLSPTRPPLLLSLQENGGQNHCSLSYPRSKYLGCLFYAH